MTKSAPFAMEFGTFYVAPKTADLPPMAGWSACSARRMRRGATVPEGCEELDTSAWGSENDTLTGVVLDTGVDESPRLVGRIVLREDGHSCGQGFATVLPSGEVASAAIFVSHGDLLEFVTYEGFIGIRITATENGNPDNPGRRATAIFSGYNAATPPFLGELGASADFGMPALVAARGALVRANGKPSTIDFTQDVDFAGPNVVMHVRNMLSVAGGDGVFSTVVETQDNAKILRYAANTKYLVWVEAGAESRVVRASPFATKPEGMKVVDLQRVAGTDDRDKLFLGAGYAIYGDKVLRLSDGARWPVPRISKSTSVIGVTADHVYLEDGLIYRVPIKSLGDPAPLDAAAAQPPPAPSASAGPADSAHL